MALRDVHMAIGLEGGMNEGGGDGSLAQTHTKSLHEEKSS